MRETRDQCVWYDEDDNGNVPTVACGAPATRLSCVPYMRSPTCEKHACRCPRVRLVRLRADPSKISVSIKREYSDFWRATVCEINGGVRAAVSGAFSPEKAIEKVLRLASDFDGIDLDLKNVYEHPQDARR